MASHSTYLHLHSDKIAKATGAETRFQLHTHPANEACSRPWATVKVTSDGHELLTIFIEDNSESRQLRDAIENAISFCQAHPDRQVDGVSTL